MYTFTVVPEQCSGNSLNLACSLLIVPVTVYWEQTQVSFLFHVCCSRNKKYGTDKKNLLFLKSCSGNAVPGIEKVHQTY